MKNKKSGNKTDLESEDAEKSDKLDFPRIGLEDKIPILLDAIHSRGGEATKQQVRVVLKTSGGAIGTIVAAAKNYGLIGTVGKAYTLTDLGNEYVNANTQEEKTTALLKAFLYVPKFKTFFEKYSFSGALPNFGILKDSVSRIGFPRKYVAIATNVIRKNLEYLKLSFQDVKNFKGINKTLNPSSNSNGKKDDGGIIFGSPDSKKIFEVEIFIGNLFNKSKISLVDLDKLKEATKDFPALQNEIERAIDQNKKGLLEEDKIGSYARIYFKQALENDLNTKLEDF